MNKKEIPKELAVAVNLVANVPCSHRGTKCTLLVYDKLFSRHNAVVVCTTCVAQVQLKLLKKM